MQVVISGKQLKIDDSLREHVEKELAGAISKYFDNAIEASLVLSSEGHGKQVRSDISVHVGRNIHFQSHAEANEAKAAFDASLERLSKRLRRYKRRLRDHQKAGSDTMPVEQ